MGTWNHLSVAGLYVPNPETASTACSRIFPTDFPFQALAPIFAKMDFSDFFTGFLVIMFAFLFVDMFDTLGTLIGVSSKADMLDKNGKLPNIKGALLADAVATTAGAVRYFHNHYFRRECFRCSEGGRTGLTAVTTAILFGLSLFLSPIFLAIPSFATAPALIIVGLYMLTNVSSIDFSDMSEAIPAFMQSSQCRSSTAFPKVFHGSYLLRSINLITGKAKEKKISALMYVLAVLFILKYIFL